MSSGTRARVGFEALSANRVPVRAIQRTCACGSHSSSHPCPACGQKLTGARASLLPERDRKPIQAKLRINPAGDVFEQEADRVAHAVLSAASPVPPAQPAGASNGSIVQAKPAVRVTHRIQRQAADAPGRADDTASRRPPVPMDLDVEEADDADVEDESLQMKAAGRMPAEITTAQESRVDALRGGGQPLSGDQRAFFEPRFGRDFSGVRLHDDGRAAASAAELGARAYTLGHDIVFASGELQPGSRGGLQLLAHELTHVVQQTGAAPGSVQRDVLQRDAAATKCGTPPEHPAQGAIAKITVFLEDKLVIVILVSGASFTLALDRDKTTISVDEYDSIHTSGSKEHDCISGADGDWRFLPGPSSPTWSSIPSSKYRLIVKDRSGAFDKNEGQGAGAKPGKGGGKDGGGAGAGKGADAGGGAGKGGDKDKGGQGGTDKGKTGGSDTAAEDHKLVADFQKKLGNAGATTTLPPDVRIAAALKTLTQAERDDLARYLREEEKKAAEEGKKFDLHEVIEFYKNLSPSDRELLRTNLELSKSQAGGATELPKEVKIALDVGAADSSAEVAKQTGALNDELKKQMGELSSIHAMVANPPVTKEDLEPINLNELPVFTDMMMLEGLLAGASSKSPEIQSISKELTTSIAGIREFVLDEIMWLAAEMAAGSIIGALLAPLTLGGSAAVATGRALILLKRLNDLRKFLQEVERIYKTVTTIRNIITKALSAYEAYNRFKAEYEKWSTRLEALQSKLEKAEIDGSDDLEGEIEKLEDLMIEELQKSLDDPAGLGALLEHLFIPAGATEDDLKEILFNIPKGVEAFRDLVTFYDSVDRTSMEDVKTLAYKGVRAGVLLYPFVGYLALVVNNALGTLMAPKSLTDRLLGIMSRSAAAGRGRRMPKRQDNRAALKRVKKSKDKPKEATSDKKPHKTKGADDPKAKKRKADDDEKKKAEAKKKADDKDKEDDGDPKKKAAREEKAKQDSEWQLVVGKVAKLPGQFAANGASQTDLLKEARKISKDKALRTVAGGPKVDAATASGFWTVTIKRKGISPAEATAKVLMSEKTRLQKGRKAVERLVADLPEKVTPGDVDSKLTPIKNDYQFKSLRAGHRTDERLGIAVFGAMGKGKETVLATIDDLTGLHYGTPEDPIPIHWYKHESYYKPIKLTVDGKSKSFPIDSPHLLTKSKRTGAIDIFVGIDTRNLVRVGTRLKRKSTIRSGQKQKDYRDALTAAGFDWTDRDADHVTDLAFAGADDFDNLWPLESAVNRWAFRGKWYTNYEIVYRDKAAPREAKESTLFRLTDKYYRVIGFKKEPIPLGGRSGSKDP